VTGSDVSHVTRTDVSHMPCPEVCSAHAQHEVAGGVAIFTKPNIYICEKPEFHTSKIEILWLEVIINNLKAMVGVIYRPPHSDVSYWRKFEVSH
jgi:hypothetical protein